MLTPMQRYAQHMREIAFNLNQALIHARQAAHLASTEQLTATANIAAIKGACANLETMLAGAEGVLRSLQ